jgi:hypothetical protein
MVKGFAELFSESFSEYGNKFVSYLKVFVFLYLIPSIIYLIAIFGLAISFIGFENISKLADSIKSSSGMNPEIAKEIMKLLPLNFWLIFAALTLVMIIFSFLMQLSYLHIALSKKSKVSFSEAFRVAKKYFWRYVGFSIVTLFFLAVLFLLLIIPGIIFMVYWVFAVYILVGENKGILESLSASKKLVKGRWWKVFGFFLLIVILAIVVDATFSFVPLIGSIVPNLVVLPFIYLFFKNFYLDLRGSHRSVYPKLRNKGAKVSVKKISKKKKVSKKKK